MQKSFNAERAERELVAHNIPIPPTPPGEETDSPKINENQKDNKLTIDHDALNALKAAYDALSIEHRDLKFRVERHERECPYLRRMKPAGGPIEAYIADAAQTFAAALVSAIERKKGGSAAPKKQ